MYRLYRVTQCEPEGSGEQLDVHRQRLGPQPCISAQGYPVHAVGMLRILLRSARHVGGNDVDLLATKAPIHFVEPHRRATLSGQVQFCDDQETGLSAHYSFPWLDREETLFPPRIIDNTSRRLCNPGRCNNGATARRASRRAP